MCGYPMRTTRPRRRPGPLTSRCRRLRRGRDEAGYVAVTVALTLTVLLSFCAFAVDVGNWYFTGQRAQRAADAAALGGVPYLPGNQTSAFSKARELATANNFSADGTTVVSPALDGRPTRLRVTVSKTVQNQFGWLMGIPTKTITKTAVADYAGPVPMGSPCNTFGNDPESGVGLTGDACASVNTQFWANVNAPATQKAQGDPFQASTCSSSWDGCSGTTNTEYDTRGYFYTVNVPAGLSRLTLQLFDPAFVNTGTGCDTNFGSASTAATGAVNDRATLPATRYASGNTAASAYCVGDYYPGGTTGVMNTQFTVRSPSASAWDPTSFPVYSSSCQKTYVGYNGSLFDALDQYTSGTTPRSTYAPDVAESFRRWTTLCTIDNPPKGEWLIQVKSNGAGADTATGSNHFGIRAYGSSVGDASAISVSGREKMSIDSNRPGAITEFYLARVPSGAAGQVLKVNLFDVGDSSTSGTIKVISPSGGDYSGCTGAGVTTSINSDCSFTANSTFNGKWQTVSIPIPSGYTCDDTVQTACWVKLRYDYGASSVPTDVTTWTANIEGDPVRLVE
jgi:Flp pilus assembly protein TadG